MTNILIIARFTIHEALSRRLVLAGLLIGLAFVGLFALGFSFVYDRSVVAPRGTFLPGVVAANLTVLGLYAVSFLSGFLALFVAVGSVSGEIDAGTLHAILARPIRRAEFIAGRWLAYVGLMSGYVGLMAGLLLLVSWLIADYVAPDPLPAVALMMLGAILLTTLSLFGSTVLSTLANGVVVFTLFALAWLAGVIELLGGVLANDGMRNVGIAVSLLVPSDALWRAASQYVLTSASIAAVGPAAPFAAGAAPSGLFIAWAALHPLVFLVASILTFSRRDL